MKEPNKIKNASLRTQKANNFKFALSTLALPSSDDKGSGLCPSQQFCTPGSYTIIDYLIIISRKKSFY